MANVHIVGIGPHDNLNEIFSLDEWDELDSIPANRQWIEVKTESEEDFAAWCEARRDYEYYDHSPRGNHLSHDQQAEMKEDYTRRCDEAEAQMAALAVECYRI